MHIIHMNALIQTYPPFPFTLQHGLKDQVFSDDGRVFWDFYGGHCVASTGHAHPRIAAAIAKQAGQLLFYSTAATLSVRNLASEALMSFAKNTGTQHVFFCNSGAEANENALKIAHKLTGKSTIASLSGGWHGRSLACLSATSDDKITKPYSNWLPPAICLETNNLAHLAQADFSDVCAVIVEPIQSLAGIRVINDVYLQALRAKCDASGSLLIFDEIQTGIGRLGTPFAASDTPIKPDLITSAKGIASGIPMAAVMMSRAIAQQLKTGDLGSTFGGGPIACAALIETLQIIADEDLMANANAKFAELNSAVQQLVNQSAEIKLLGSGLLLGLQTPKATALKAYLFERGILVGGSSDASVLRLMPPLNLSDDALDALIAALSEFYRFN
jgi:acetylornithine/N-succinyldiaminopimelate aminotransferase